MMTMGKNLSILIRWLCLPLTMLLCATAQAQDLAVVVNPLNDVKQLSQSEVINLYMGRKKKLGQNSVLPLDLIGTNPVKLSFYKHLMDKDLSEINSYWARLIFSGQGSPPRQMDSIAEIRQTIRDNLGAIGYVPVNEITEDLKVVFRIKANQ